MDIYSFINSKDIAKHCRKTNKTWTPFEMAVIIAQSNKTLDKKHSAWRQLLAEHEDTQIIKFYYGHEINLHKHIPTLIRYHELFVKTFTTPEAAAVYQCTWESKTDCYGREHIHSTFEKSLAFAKRHVTKAIALEKGLTLNIYKMRPDYEECLNVEVDYAGNFLSLEPYDGHHGWSHVLPEMPDCISDMFSMEIDQDGNSVLKILVKGDVNSDIDYEYARLSPYEMKRKLFCDENLNFDKIAFKKQIEKVNIGGNRSETYILSEIIINGHSLLDTVQKYWKIAHVKGSNYFDYNLAKSLYLELTNDPEAQDHDGWPQKNTAVLFVCPSCYIEADTPLVTTFEETATEVIWSGLYFSRLAIDEFDKNLFPISFRFEKEQYYAALADLKAIALE